MSQDPLNPEGRPSDPIDGGWKGDSENPLPWRGGDELDVPAQMSRFDHEFANTALPFLVAFPCCFGFVAVGVSLVGIIACRDPRARRNAILVFWLSIVWFVMAIAIVELKR